MKTILKNLPWLQVALMLAVVNLEAQTYTNYHNFAAIKQDTVTFAQTNRDGGNPYATMVISGNTLYGTTAGGGTNGLGTIFKINTDGTGFTNIFTFTFINDQPTNGDNGSGPSGGLFLTGNTLYGTTREGGLRTNYYGSIFALKTNGTGFTNLHYFSTLVSNKNSEGASPGAALTLADSMLYGVAYSGAFIRMEPYLPSAPMGRDLPIFTTLISPTAAVPMRHCVSSATGFTAPLISAAPTAMVLFSPSIPMALGSPITTVLRRAVIPMPPIMTAPIRSHL
jgi:uncharacterized repeat protein (TIGR03803 family)